MSMPLARPCFDHEEEEAVIACLRSGWVTQGPKVAEFEAAFANHIDAKYACAVSSCTTALHLGLKAVGVKRNDLVITVSHSFIATANSIKHCSAEPYFIDIDDSLNMSPERLEWFLSTKCYEASNEIRYCADSRRIAAILVVHQLGIPADMTRIMAIAKRYDLPVVEDAACALGSELLYDSNWQKIGKPIGDVVCFSFHPRKIIATGDGGMITTDNEEYDKLFRLWRHHGMSISDLERHNNPTAAAESYPVVGYNYRMTDIQASIGIVQLSKLSGFVAERRVLAARYALDLKNVSGLTIFNEESWQRCNWQSYPVTVASEELRAVIMSALAEQKIASKMGVMNAHEQPAYYRCLRSDLPVSERVLRTTMLLPMYNSMTIEDVDTVAAAIRSIL